MNERPLTGDHGSHETAPAGMSAPPTPCPAQRPWRAGGEEEEVKESMVWKKLGAWGLAAHQKDLSRQSRTAQPRSIAA